jgi:hypothetical protein
MKPRAMVFWTALTIGSLLVGHWLRAVDPPRPSVVHVRPASTWDKVTYWWAIWTLAKHAPQMPPPDFRFQRQDIPDHIVNAPPDRQIGPDGEPLLAHGEGW